MQRMTDFCQIVSMSRLFETLEWRVFRCPTLRNLSVSYMGLLRFNLFEVVKNKSYIKLEPKIYTNPCLNWQKRNSPRGLFLFQQFVDFLAEVGVAFLQPSSYKEAGKQASDSSA